MPEDLFDPVNQPSLEDNVAVMSKLAVGNEIAIISMKLRLNFRISSKALPTFVYRVANACPGRIPVNYSYRPGIDVWSGRSESIKKNNMFYRLKVHE